MSKIARERPVSRQHVQTVVNRLLDEGLVESLPNPPHSRSLLLRRSPAGRARSEQIGKREQAPMEDMVHPFPEADIRQASDTLQRLQNYLASGRWRLHGSDQT